eukprot:m.30564 g.30564  ORF g.30564 m.30564 type:complete len:289 (-) comp16309_c0_seq1:36-902(-)
MSRRATPLTSCFVCLPPDQVGVWECCQKYQGKLSPGCHFLGCNVCGLCITVRKVSTRLRENACTCETKTKDNVFVTITTKIQQEPIISQVKDAIYILMNPDSQIESYVADVVRAQVPKMTLDEVFEHKDAIALAVKEKLTTEMIKFGYNINQALVTNVEPDANVKRALNAVEAAVKDRQAAETKAKAQHFVMVKRAEAEAESKALQGQGIAKQRAAIVDGLRESIGFDENVDNSKEVSELLLVTQYFDCLEKVAEGAGTTVFIPSGNGSSEDTASDIRNGIMQANARK